MKRQRKRLKVTQCQLIFRSIAQRISTDTTPTAAEFTSLADSAAKLAGTLHKLDQQHIARVKQERKDQYRSFGR